MESSISVNPISKELRHEIYKKVGKALEKKEDDSLEKAKLKYKGRIAQIVELHIEFESKRHLLEKELKSQNFELREHNDLFEIEFARWNVDQDEIVSRIVVALQYSKEPDFLKLIDDLVQKEIPQKVTV